MPKPSIAILKNPHFQYGSWQTPAHAAQNARGKHGPRPAPACKVKKVAGQRGVSASQGGLQGGGQFLEGCQGVPGRSQGGSQGGPRKVLGGSRVQHWKVWGPHCIGAYALGLRRSQALQASSTGRLYPPSPFCRDARSGTSVEASSAHVNGHRRSRQFRV